MKKKIAPKVIEYNPRHESHGYKHVRWVENVSRGLRLVGFADEIARKEGSRGIEHKGWFTIDDCCDEVYRGIVYQIPSHGDEKECYVYGYADPNNDDCALLCFDLTGDKMEAARCADRFAEIFAEESREYHEAWSAGRKADDLAEEVKATRREALAIGEEMRAAKRAELDAPTICATLRAKVRSAYRQIQKMRKQRAELIDTFGSHPGFVE